MTKPIYADYAAHAPLSAAARDTLTRCLAMDETCGNPSSLHPYGETAAAILANARQTIADWCGVPAHRLFFTSGGTESDYVGIYALAHTAVGRRTIVRSAVEHPAVSAACDCLAREGFAVRIAPVDENGVVTVASVASVWTEDTGLCTVLAAQNETGVVMPIAALADFAHSHDAYFFTDAVSFAPYRSPHALAPYVDGLSVAAHKCGGPLGVGALYLRDVPGLRSPISGGGQESGMRGGTESFPLAAAFAAAVSERTDARAWECAGRRMEETLRARFPTMRIPGEAAERVGGIHCLVFPALAARGVTGENLALSLAMVGLYASPGAACHSGSDEPSATLRAMGYPPETARAMIRLSFGHGVPETEYERSAEVIGACVERMLTVSEMDGVL